MKHNNTKKDNGPDQNINRKEAIKKAGKYAAFTAATMLVVLSSKGAPATSPGNPAPPTPW